MASDGRKSLMIGKEAHSHLMQLVETFGVSQPDLVEALISSVDKMRLASALTEITAKRTRAKEEEAKKRTLMEKALREMSAADLEKLLAQN